MKIIADANIPYVKECFSSAGNVELLAGRQIAAEKVADADALLVRSVTPVNAALLEGSAVRFVATATIGFDHVDVDYLQRKGIGFASAPGSNANSAAEYVIAALLEVAAHKRLRLEGKSVGIVGVGNVGSRVAAKCEALGMQVLRNDPPLQRQTGDPRYMPLEGLFDCDVITFHTPLTFDGPDKTYHLAGEHLFASLKPGCVFVNASRGAVVDTAALRQTIRSGKLNAVALDVWENEPNIDTELLEMVDLGTPHIAGYSLDGKIAGMIVIYKALCAHFGLKPQHDAEDFLPAADVPHLRIGTISDNDEATLNGTVKHVYDIAADDARLRRILAMEPDHHGRFFDTLRKEYPVRREFHNTQVVLNEPSDALAAKLRGIGFRVTGA